MKNGCTAYPNTGVKIDPRTITSERMPESTRVYSGFLTRGYFALAEKGILKSKDIGEHGQRIKKLQPFCDTRSKKKSSYFFMNDTHIIEFLRTTAYNFKIYALEKPSIDTRRML